MSERVGGKRKASESVGDVEGDYERYGGEQPSRDHKRATDAMEKPTAAAEKAAVSWEEAADVFDKASLASREAAAALDKCAAANTVNPANTATATALSETSKMMKALIEREQTLCIVGDSIWREGILMKTVGVHGTLADAENLAQM
ncbi:hypothetical protein CSAL01_07194 [Colletotrichum salicis]|uniref:Uncharacterized protein n=1 Tax=Colletotrichum salicis TaxID=1209931 RepID=A0A135T8G2_9PEZI|nr:hypothetical protein CSAL01_07194 [Colletotrichum salicis]